MLGFHKVSRLLAKDKVTSFLRAHPPVEGRRGRRGLLGNLPHALSHVGLINAAQALTDAPTSAG